MNPVHRSRALRIAGFALVAAAVAGADIATKRWAEEHLATATHLLPVDAPADPGDATVGDVARTRFPELTDDALRGALVRLPPAVALDAADPVFELETARGVEAAGFLVFDRGARRFARRIDRTDQYRRERGLMRADPALSFPDARRRVRAELADVRLDAFLAERLPHLRGDALADTLARGLHPIPSKGIEVDPTDPAVAGATYLVAHRTVTWIPGHLGLAYVQNPAGAWGLFGWVDARVRPWLFHALSALAIAAILALALRPPSAHAAVRPALALVLGGAIGNLHDRVALAYVVDFVHMYWGRAHWPRYNVADVAISLGVIALLAATLARPAPPRTGRTP